MKLRHHDDSVQSITDAPEAPEVEFRRRRNRYIGMMIGRVVCLVAAAVVMTAHVPYAPLWAVLCIAGMVGLPWAAVLIANDRAPLRRSERGRVSRPKSREVSSAEPPRALGG